MNGRVYDYNLGRFMSVDPFIQSPTNSQSMNPYSYIMNNPLSGTDPTGYKGDQEAEVKQVEKISSEATTGSRLKSTTKISSTTSGGKTTATKTVSNGAGQVMNTAYGSSGSGSSGGTTAIGAPESISKNNSTSVDGTDGKNSRSERQVKADEFVEKEYGEILRVGEIDLSENIRKASEMGLSDFSKWVEKVDTLGDWDYKNNQKLLDSGLFTTKQLDEFGNFHFGMVAAAYGFSLNASVTGAGANQAFRQGGGSMLEATVSLISGAFSPVRATQVRREVMSGWTYGDNKGDSFHIMRGWDYSNIKTNDRFVR